MRASNKIEELLSTASKAEMVGLGGRGRDEATLQGLRPALLRQQIIYAAHSQATAPSYGPADSERENDNTKTEFRHFFPTTFSAKVRQYSWL